MQWHDHLVISLLNQEICVSRRCIRGNPKMVGSLVVMVMRYEMYCWWRALTLRRRETVHQFPILQGNDQIIADKDPQSGYMVTDVPLLGTKPLSLNLRRMNLLFWDGLLTQEVEWKLQQKTFALGVFMWVLVCMGDGWHSWTQLRNMARAHVATKVRERALVSIVSSVVSHRAPWNPL